MLRATFVPMGFALMAEGDPATITSTLGTAFGTVKTDCLSAITTVLPYALAVLGAVAVIGIGIKIWKKVAGK